MKKTLALLLTLAMMMATFGAWGIFAADTPQISETPTPISTPEDFEKMTQFGNYYLTGDINFEGKEYKTAYIIEKFDGILDGKGHTIYGFSINSTQNKDSGIFSLLGNTGGIDTTIRDLNIGKPGEGGAIKITATGGYCVGGLAGATYVLTMENVNLYLDLTVPATSTVCYSVGGYFGQAKSVVMTDCNLYGTVAQNGVWSSKGRARAAGFVGHTPTTGEASFIDCENHATIICNSSANNQAASGFVGLASQPVSFDGCANYGDVSVAAGATKIGAAGGFVGYSEKAVDINGCVNYGAINGKLHAAGMVGTGSTVTSITNSVNFGAVSAGTTNAIATAAITTASGNMAMTLPTTHTGYTASEAVKFVGTQESAVESDLFNVRFLAVVDGVEYTSVGYEIVAYVDHDGDGKLSEWKYTHTTSNVYNKVTGTDAEGKPFEATAAELGGSDQYSYLYALTTKKVPAAASAGSVVFFVKPFATTASGTVYGASAVCVYNSGVYASVTYAK